MILEREKGRGNGHNDYENLYCSAYHFGATLQRETFFVYGSQIAWKAAPLLQRYQYKQDEKRFGIDSDAQ